jgi:putative ABC transport system permease protein
MIIITRGMTDSFRGDLEVWIDAYIGGDLMVSSSTPMRSQVMRRLQGVPGVQAVTPMRTLSTTWLKPGGEEQELVFMAVDPGTYNQVTSFVFSDSQTDVQAAYQQLAAGDTVFISSVLAEKYGLQPGSLMRLRTRSGLHDFTIAAVVVNFFNQGLTIQGSWQDMRRYFKTDDANAYLVKVTPGISISQVQKQIEDSYARRENLTVLSNQALIDQVFDLLNQAYSMFDAMAIIAMLVGALGVVNTLTMNVVERTQEIGMLRSIGLTRRQTLVMVLAEALLMGLIGGLFGLVFGAVLTRIFLWSMTAMSGYKITFVLPLSAILIGLVIALVVSQLAALFPARRAAHIQILQAIHYE